MLSKRNYFLINLWKQKKISRQVYKNKRYQLIEHIKGLVTSE